MGKHIAYILVVSLLVVSACTKPHESTTNPWLVPFLERQTSTVSRSQMRAMTELAHVYKNAGLENEYVLSMVTAIDIYAGDRDVTFELLNHLIDRINNSRASAYQLKNNLTSAGIDPLTLNSDNLPTGEFHDIAAQYLTQHNDLNTQYEECYRILKSAALQIPYDPELYYRVASLQYIRAEDDGDRDKYKDAIFYLKRAIASDSGHLESYHLIAMCFEKLNDKDRAIRFWQLFEIIYQIAPQVMGQNFITPDRQKLHDEALQHLNQLGAKPE
jgi:tetratricopeptide (TPR) repeat protein